MGIVILKVAGKIVGRVLVGTVMVGGVMYLEYRLAGGPPIRKVYKAIKDKRLKDEIEKAKKEGKVIYLEDYQMAK